MLKKNIKYIFIILLLADITYSFIQHYNLPLDGDMSYLIMPFDGFKQLMNDPFGLSALCGNVYLGTNRFFAHWTMASYFKSAPFICQYITNPIDSLYLSCAVAKTIIQIFLIWLLSAYISRSTNILKKEFLLSAVLITPLFQTWGYNGFMGIIDCSITYTFFYALPLSLLMFFFLPFYNSKASNQVLKFNPITCVLFVILIVYLSLNGPLIPATVIIICPSLLIYGWWTSYTKSLQTSTIKKFTEAFRQIPRLELFYFTLFTIVCLYSFYIGRFNSANFVNPVPLLKRYSLLMIGIYYQITKSHGPQLLFLIIAINAIIISRHKYSEEAMRLMKNLKWIVILSSIYIILLPLGGYREYRPYIIRWDTIMPINLSLFYFYGISTLYLIKQFSSKVKIVYLTGIAVFLLIFTLADKTDYNANTCEKEAIKAIAKSKDKIVLLRVIVR